LPFRSPSYFLQTEKTLEIAHKELVELKKSLDAYGDVMRDVEVYQKVYAVVAHLLEQISKVPLFMTLIEEELEKFVKTEKRKR